MPNLHQDDRLNTLRYHAMTGAIADEFTSHEMAKKQGISARHARNLLTVWYEQGLLKRREVPHMNTFKYLYSIRMSHD